MHYNVNLNQTGKTFSDYLNDFTVFVFVRRPITAKLIQIIMLCDLLVFLFVPSSFIYIFIF